MNNRFQANQASIGCGSLILIAIVVALFSNSRSNQTDTKVESLTAQAKTLERQLFTLEQKMDLMLIRAIKQEEMLQEQNKLIKLLENRGKADKKVGGN